MIYIIIGIIGFVSFLVFDFMSLKQRAVLKYAFIIVGTGLILWSTVELVQSPIQYALPIVPRIIALILAVIFFALLIYSVFIEVGIKTYKRVAKHELVTDGTYSLVRHPGVIWLFLAYFFLAVFNASNELLWTAFVWTLANTLYIIIQERFILKKLFSEYENYTLTTPMVIPNLKSLRKFITATNWRKE